MKLKKNRKIFTCKFVGTGTSSYEKRIYRAAVSQRLRNTVLHDIRLHEPPEFLPLPSHIALCCKWSLWKWKISQRWTQTPRCLRQNPPLSWPEAQILPKSAPRRNQSPACQNNRHIICWSIEIVAYMDTIRLLKWIYLELYIYFDTILFIIWISKLRCAF